MEDVIGVNDENMNSLILEIGNERDSISNIFNSFEDSMSHVAECLKCPAGETIVRKFQDIQKNFSQITNNLDVYGEDLIRAKANGARIDFKATTVVNQAMVHVDDFTNQSINTEVK
jgi:hypothetical protein